MIYITFLQYSFQCLDNTKISKFLSFVPSISFPFWLVDLNVLPSDWIFLGPSYFDLYVPPPDWIFLAPSVFELICLTLWLAYSSSICLWTDCLTLWLALSSSICLSSSSWAMSSLCFISLLSSWCLKASSTVFNFPMAMLKWPKAHLTKSFARISILKIQV